MTLGLLHNVVQESSAEYWFARGQAAEAVEQWAETAYAYQQCVERKASFWRGTVRLAAALAYLGQAEAAAGALTKASEVAVEGWKALVAELPEPTWHYLRKCLETARSTAQDGFGLLLGLALVYRTLKQGEQARRTLDVMQFMYQQQVAGSARWLRLSGNLHLDAGCYNEAVGEYDRAIELKPDFATAYYNRGFAKDKLKDLTGSITNYGWAIELKPNYAAAYHNRGNVKNKIQDFTGAIADYDCVIALIPNFALAYRNRGLTKENLEDYTGAITDYDHAIELEPNKVKYYFLRACAREKLQDYAGVLSDIDHAVELKPNNAEYYFLRAWTRENLKDYIGAITDYDRAIVLEPEDEAYYRFRADMKENLGDIAGATADQQKAAQLIADNKVINPR